jgi:hypothetical protein
VSTLKRDQENGFELVACVQRTCAGLCASLGETPSTRLLGAIGHYRGSAICDGYKIGYKMGRPPPNKKTKGPRVRAFCSSGGGIWTDINDHVPLQSDLGLPMTTRDGDSRPETSAWQRASDIRARSLEFAQEHRFPGACSELERTDQTGANAERCHSCHKGRSAGSNTPHGSAEAAVSCSGRAPAAPPFLARRHQPGRVRGRCPDG